MRLMVGDLELNCALVAMIDSGEFGKLELRRLGMMVVKLSAL